MPAPAPCPRPPAPACLQEEYGNPEDLRRIQEEEDYGHEQGGGQDYGQAGGAMVGARPRGHCCPCLSLPWGPTCLPLAVLPACRASHAARMSAGRAGVQGALCPLLMLGA